MKCPKCGSLKIEIVEYMNSKVRVCKECGYDERDDLDMVPSERNSQREKGRFSPYKSGGKNRIGK